MRERIDKGAELWIDALRGLAALFVFSSHVFDQSVADLFGGGFAENPEHWRLFRAVFGTGGNWVWCFFLISGFCIHRSILSAKEQGHFSLPQYAFARITRIYPLFLLGLLLAVVTWKLAPELAGGTDGGVLKKFVATVLNLQVFTSCFPAFDTSWSLTCEVVYYGIWPVMLMLGWKRVGFIVCLTVVGSLIIAGAILVMWKGYHIAEDRAFVEGTWTVAVLFPVWLAGAWLAHRWESVEKKISRRLWIAGMIAFAISSAVLFWLRYHDCPFKFQHVASWLSVPGLLIMIAGGRHARLAEKTEAVKRCCQWLGKLSYPCYILHLQCILLVDHFVVPLLPDAITQNVLWRAAVIFICVLPFVLKTCPWLEEKVMSWRAKWMRSAALISGKTSVG